MVFDDSSRVALVTAASQGIGEACAKKLAGLGYRVALLARSDRVLDLATSLGGIGVLGDVTQEASIARLVETAYSEFGRLDAVVSNTGHPSQGDLLTIGDAQWHASLDLLLLNVVRIARLTVPKMQEVGGGSFVNISTLGAVEPNGVFPVSSTIRAALAAFTKLFADRYAADRIRMNNVLPGFVDSFEVSEETRSRIPMRRPATKEEVADLVSFLLGPEAAYITGQSVRIDGGLGRSI